jgi:4-oxalocrotonate tautomerase
MRRCSSAVPPSKKPTRRDEGIRGMPFIHVYAYEGRTLEQKRQLVKAITEATCAAYDVPPETVHIYLFDQPRSDAAQAGILAIDEEKPR